MLCIANWQLHGICNEGARPYLDKAMKPLIEHVRKSERRMFGHELSKFFVPFDVVQTPFMYRELCQVDGYPASKCSTLGTADEYKRCWIRNHVNPDFRQLTGNDYDIEIFVKGGGNILGLLAPFSREAGLRDRLFLAKDARWKDINWHLQRLGFELFTAPVPLYKHDVHAILEADQVFQADSYHPDAPKRPVNFYRLKKIFEYREALRNLCISIDPTIYN